MPSNVKKQKSCENSNVEQIILMSIATGCLVFGISDSGKC